MRQGERRGTEIDLYDFTYDGTVDDTQLSGGLGQLTDGSQGIDNFRLPNQHGRGVKVGLPYYINLKIKELNICKNEDFYPIMIEPEEKKITYTSLSHTIVSKHNTLCHRVMNGLVGGMRRMDRVVQ